MAAVDDLAKMLRECLVSVILVSNEVGQGVHPPTELGRRFLNDLQAMFLPDTASRPSAKAAQGLESPAVIG